MTRRTGRQLGSRPEAEQLEHRSLLAGNVLVAVHSGELDITGDNFSNGVQIAKGSNGHQFTVTGLNDSGATTINGKAAVSVDGVTDDVKIDLAGGDDELSVNNTSTPVVFLKDLRISMGSGNDIVSLGDVTVDGDLEIQNRSDSGRGTDSIALGNVTVRGDTKIQTGAGNDTVLITSSNFRSKLEVDLGAGNDALSLVNSQVGDDFQVDGRDGFDTFTSQGNVFGGNVEIKNVESLG